MSQHNQEQTRRSSKVNAGPVNVLNAFAYFYLLLSIITAVVLYTSLDASISIGIALGVIAQGLIVWSIAIVVAQMGFNIARIRQIFENKKE